MKRLRRWLFNAVVGISFLLCLAVVALWVRSHSISDLIRMKWERWPQEDVWRSQSLTLRFVKGHWIMNLEELRRVFDPAEGAGDGIDAGGAAEFRKEHRGGFEFTRAPGDNRRRVNASRPSNQSISFTGGNLLTNSYGFRYSQSKSSTRSRQASDRVLTMPAWLPLIITLLLPAVWATRLFLIRKRFAEGCCKVCGYDLRATPDRCPECGTVPETAKGATT